MNKNILKKNGWKIIKNVDTLSQKLNIKLGEIIKHRSGSVVFNCPYCSALQFAVVEIIGTDERPTFKNPVQCGGGYCDKCKESIQITKGSVSLVNKEETK